jgi:hypothetical protein
MKYILIDLERSIGTGRVHFWKQTKHGYTTIPAEAGRFDEVEAHKMAIEDFDSNTVPVADSQAEKILRKYGELE